MESKKDSRIEAGGRRLFSCHEIVLTDKTYRLCYEDLEKSSTRKLRDEVTGSISVSGAGMASLYWDMDTLFHNSAILVIAVILFLRYLYLVAAGIPGRILVLRIHPFLSLLFYC